MNNKVKLFLSTLLITTSFLTSGVFTQNVFAATTPYIKSQNVFADVSAVSRHVEATSDGGSIVTGSGTIDGVNGLYVAKLDSAGSKVWQKVIAGAGVGNSVQATSDNCYIAVSSNSHIVKLDAQGQLVWNKVISGSPELDSLEPSNDGNLVICGCISTTTNKYDTYLCKIDINGNIIFSKSYGTVNNDFGQAVQQTVDGGYIILGETMPSSYQYMYLVKVDRNGNLLWGKSVGANGGSGKDIKVTADGSFILAGAINYKGALLKTSSTGSLLWSKILNDWSIDGIELDTDGFMLVGNVKGTAFSSDFDLQVMKTDLSGTKIWDYVTTEYNAIDYSRSITKTLDGGFVAVGDTHADQGYGTANITYLKFGY